MSRRRWTVRALMAAIALVAVVLAAYRLGGEAARPAALVWVTRSGTRYHREGCRYLRSGGVPTPLDRAKGSYRPCRACRPPA